MSTSNMQEIHEKLDLAFRRAYYMPTPPVGEVITGDPILPPELEREIFELAAAIPNYWRTQDVEDMALVLPQVCRRAQTWIEPLIYERISLPPSWNRRDLIPRFLETSDARPASFFAAQVKYLYFDDFVELAVVQRVLSVCTGVVYLGCHHPYSSISPLLTPLPLQRLLVSELDLQSAPADLPPWATSLTHLGISETLPQDPNAVFVALPALTHLAIGYRACLYSDVNSVLEGLFRAVPHLGCLVVVTRHRGEMRELSRALHNDRFDARLKTYGKWARRSRLLPDIFGTAEGQFTGRRDYRHLI
ncbi:hypothetical protein B0H19DRAFT_1059846 [Mycena capillaripes]|nr:hypothetical protein B0H19DRAFT_1059846 [Mycena capillaripes]